MNPTQLPQSKSVCCIYLCCTLNSHLMSKWFLAWGIITCSTKYSRRLQHQTAADKTVTQIRRYAAHTMACHTPDRFGQELVHVKLVQILILSLPSLGQHRAVLLQYWDRKHCHSQSIKPYLRYILFVLQFFEWFAFLCYAYKAIKYTQIQHQILYWHNVKL